MINIFPGPPQLCGDSLRLCWVSQAELWPWGMWHRVLLPLSAAVAPQPDMWPGAAPASPSYFRRQRCLHAVRLQWRTRRRFVFISNPLLQNKEHFPCFCNVDTLTVMLKMQRRSKHALAVVPTSWRPMMAAATVWTALSVPVSSAGCVCRRSPMCTTSGTQVMNAWTYQIKYLNMN